LDSDARDIEFLIIFVTENSNKLQKPRFWKEKSVENFVTFADLPFNSSMISFHIGLFKNGIYNL
jgi:hypothetical protein